MVEEQDLSIITPMDGYLEACSLSEFTDSLMPNLLSSKKLEEGWVFWTAEIYQHSEIKQKIISATEAMAKELYWLWPCMVQFWAAVVDGQHHFLTTFNQPFCVGHLSKGFCWYRKRCMDYNYDVADGAKEDQLGPIGRVYRNKRPESSPELRLYSTTEFQLRDDAARCGLSEYLALPVFDPHNNDCYGVLEAFSFGGHGHWIEDLFHSSHLGLQQAGLRSTHIYTPGLGRMESMEQERGELSKMLELAIQAVPQLHMAQVWVPCKQCPNLSCMERATFIKCGRETVNSLGDVDRDMIKYLMACRFHNLQVEKGIVRALMSSNSTSCFYRNICDLKIFENPLAHYAQRARLSLCFAVCLESADDSNDICVAEFFLQSNSRQDACGDSFLHLLLRTMEMELKSYKFALGQRQRLGEELVVELSQPIAIQYESIEYKGEIMHQCSEELNTFVLMEGCKEIYSELNFQKYLQTADLCRQRPPERREWGWVFCSPDREELSENNLTSNSSFFSNLIKEKIIVIMKKLCINLFDSYNLVQFWAPKMEKDRRYLATLDQPFVVGRLHKGLASFRKRCMNRQYFVDEEAKEEELGPPGRAFRNGHPEISPDLRLYSTREFSLRNHAAHCGLLNYVALPLFDLNQSHECLGVLELVGHSDSTEALNYFLETIIHSLQEANLSSNHINFKPSFQITESRELALTEIRDALNLISKIPQVHMTEVWVPCSKCASINSDVSCMELAEARGTKEHIYWDEFTEMRYVPDLPKCEIYAPTNKGIAGMVLASEDNSCFCRNSCDFCIGEQPLSHYAQRTRLDVCFAICLQSSHTGNLLYFLEFFLHQGPATCEYLRSFLKFLLPIMKRELTSFKVASGKQLGEELVVEVIQFSEVNKLTFSEPHQPDMFPLKFKFVQHGQKEHQHTNDLEMQYVPDGVDSVTNGAQAKDCSTAADNSKEKEHQHANDQEMQYVSEGNYSVTSGAQTRECSSAVDNSKKTKKRKGKTTSRLVTLEDLEPLFGKTLEEAKAELRVARSTIKRVLRDNGILRWPNTENQKKNLSLSMKGSASCEIAQDSQQNIRPSSSGNPPLQQNVPQTNTESTQYIAVQAEAQKVIVEVTYEGDTIKFQLYLSSGIEKLVEEVVRRLNLKKGSFKLKYVDEDEKQILLACDDDLELCPRSVTATGKTCIQLLCYPK